MSEKPRRKRRTFSAEFTQDAVDLVVKQKYTFAAAARAMDIEVRSLREWHTQFAPPPEPCSGDASMQALREENKQLRKQLEQAQLERDILKKATAYFVKESQ